MASPRKVSRSSSQSDSGRKRWPTDDEAAPAATARAGGDTDLVAIVRGLAAAVAEHGLSELVVDTPDATFTLRRGQVTVQTVQAAMPQMSMPMPMGLPTMQVPMMPSAAPPAAPVAPASAPSAPAAAVEDEKHHAVTSPFVGTFYRRPNPDSPEYVKVNDRVKKGQVLCIIEAMKLMNEIEADIDGTLVGVLAEDGAPVEYGQPLFKIAP